MGKYIMEEIIIKINSSSDVEKVITNKLIKAFDKCDNVMGAMAIFDGIINSSVREKYGIDENDQVDIRKLCKDVGLSHLYDAKFSELWGDLNVRGNKNIKDFDISILEAYDYEDFQDDFGDVEGIVIKFYNENRDCSDILVPMISHPSIADNLSMSVPHPDTALIIKGARCTRLNKYKYKNKNKYYVLTFRKLLESIPDYNKSIMDMIKN